MGNSTWPPSLTMGHPPEIAVENSRASDAWIADVRQNSAVAVRDAPMRSAGVLTERFYSGQRDGQMTFRDGVGGAKTRLLERHLLSPNKRGGERLTRPSDRSGRAEIALTLLADALGDEGRAVETHEYFSRRVVALFPQRWTITRSRVLAYVDLIEHEKRAGLADRHSA